MSDLVRVENAGLSRRAQLTSAVLQEEVEQRQLLGTFVKTLMVDGSDFGKIPGTDKPTLLKPGAEKLMDLFRCTPEFHLVPEFSREDFEKGFFKYTFRCRVLSRDGGAVLAEGFGSANSRESRYRWRTASRRCPACGKAAIIAGKPEWGGGWVCFKKKDGCGQKFGKGDPQIELQPVGRVENEDIADLDNTILKMAKKRALVDASIALARCSDMFTQDAEDFEDPDREPEGGANEQPSKPAQPNPTKPAAVHANEQPSKAATTVLFGPSKGKSIPELTPDELQEAIAMGAEKLKAATPADKWEPYVRANLVALNAEAELRLRAKPVVPPAAPAPEPVTEHVVPF